MLANAGYAAAFGSMAGQLLSVARAAEDAGESAVCASMAFANSPKAKFDVKYYRDKHLPMLKSIYGNSVERIELRTPRKLPTMGGGRADQSHVPTETPAPMGPPSKVLAAVNMWIRDVKAFGEKTSAASQAIAKDLAEVTDVEPAAQYDKVLLLLGDSRSSIEPAGQVFSLYFPATEGGQFDAKYYGEKVIPLMVSLYGKEAIRRVEYTIGSSGQGGTKPTMLAAAHFYIRNRQAWDAGGMKAYPQLMAEGPKYTNLIPITADTEVTAVG
jgi:hypothetical protein